MKTSIALVVTMVFVLCVVPPAAADDFTIDLEFDESMVLTALQEEEARRLELDTCESDCFEIRMNGNLRSIIETAELGGDWLSMARASRYNVSQDGLIQLHVAMQPGIGIDEEKYRLYGYVSGRRPGAGRYLQMGVHPEDIREMLDDNEIEIHYIFPVINKSATSVNGSGTVVSEAIDRICADEYGSPSVNGTGVTIAIIDAQWCNLASSGDDLPTYGMGLTGMWICESGTCSEEYTDELFTGTSTRNDCGDVYHGSIMAEAVYDLAPGAEYHFIHRIHADIDTHEAVAELVTNGIPGVDVVVWAEGWTETSYEKGGDGDLRDAVSAITDSGIHLIVSSGNSALDHYYNVDTGSDQIYYLGEDIHLVRFNGTDITDEYWNDYARQHTVEAGERVCVTVTWDNPAGTYFSADRSLHLMSFFAYPGSQTPGPLPAGWTVESTSNSAHLSQPAYNIYCYNAQDDGTLYTQVWGNITHDNLAPGQYTNPHVYVLNFGHPNRLIEDHTVGEWSVTDPGAYPDCVTVGGQRVGIDKTDYFHPDFWETYSGQSTDYSQLDLLAAADLSNTYPKLLGGTSGAAATAGGAFALLLSNSVADPEGYLKDRGHQFLNHDDDAHGEGVLQLDYNCDDGCEEIDDNENDGPDDECPDCTGAGDELGHGCECTVSSQTGIGGMAALVGLVLVAARRRRAESTT